MRAKGDLAAAEPLLREALEARRETLGDRHPDTLISINSLGVLLKEKGELAAAEPLFREALVMRRKTLGKRHPDTLISASNLGLLLKAKWSSRPQWNNNFSRGGRIYDGRGR